MPQGRAFTITSTSGNNLMHATAVIYKYRPQTSKVKSPPDIIPAGFFMFAYVSAEWCTTAIFYSSTLSQHPRVTDRKITTSLKRWRTKKRTKTRCA